MFGPQCSELRPLAIRSLSTLPDAGDDSGAAVMQPHPIVCRGHIRLSVQVSAPVVLRRFPAPSGSWDFGQAPSGLSVAPTKRVV